MVVAALLATAATARADRRPVLVVDATTDGRGQVTVTRLEAALAAEASLGPVGEDIRAALSAPPVVDDSWRAAAATATGQARASLARFAYREAGDRAAAALDRLAAVADDAEARRTLAELALLQGQAEVGAGDLVGAEQALRLVHRFDPGRTLDPARYLPEVVAAFVAAGRPSEQVGKLRVVAPGAAEVLVDGAVVGGEPVTVEVSPGPHLVAVRGEAITTIGRRVTAAAGETVQIELTPVVAPLAVRVGRALVRLRAAADDRALVDSVATLLGLAQARDAVVVVGDGGPAVRLYTARGGLGPARPVDDAGAALAPLRPLAPRPRVRPPVTPPPVELGPWYQQPQGKLAIGVGVAATLAAVVVAIVARDPGTSSLVGRPEVP